MSKTGRGGAGERVCSQLTALVRYKVEDLQLLRSNIDMYVLSMVLHFILYGNNWENLLEQKRRFVSVDHVPFPSMTILSVTFAVSLAAYLLSFIVKNTILVIFYLLTCLQWNHYSRGFSVVVSFA